MFLSGKHRPTSGKKFVVKLPYLLNKCNSFSVSFFFYYASKFCAKHARHHDVSEHLGISGDWIQFPLAILFETKPAIISGSLAGMVFNVI